MVGIAGHNGAGKSTLLKVLNGTVAGDAGRVVVGDHDRSATQTVTRPERVGVRTVYQELALAPSLRVDETAAVFDGAARGWRWRSSAWRRLRNVLDEMFPSHGISGAQVIEDLPIAKRQMIECAMTMVEGERSAALVILDEPTSSLDGASTESFYAFLRRRAATGLSVIVTTHRLNEMIDNLDRIYVMRDGRVLGEHAASAATKDSLVTAMGVAAHAQRHDQPAVTSASSQTRATAVENARAAGDGAIVSLRQRAEESDRDEAFDVRMGEIVGFAGLEGHGQVAVLEAVRRSAASRAARRGRSRSFGDLTASVVGDAAYVSGDRGVRGIFPLWDVRRNISFSALAGPLTSGGIIRTEPETELVDEWYRRLGIKGEPSDGITSLSGGTQQKALMARAMAVHSSVLLLEDPTRGVDQATKGDFYAILREQADKGQTVLWYSTENEELRNCDRVFVFRSGRIAGELAGDDATEDAIIAMSFEGDDAPEHRDEIPEDER